jgi:hypothetical protein
MMVKRCLLLVGCAVGLSPANAQDFQVFVDSGISSSIAAIANANTQAAINRERGSAVRPVRGQPNVRSNFTSPARASVANPASLFFTPSLSNRKRNLAQFVAKTRAQSPDNADQMAKLFASTDVIGAMGSAIAPYGLSTNNVADAYAVYWIAAWEASRGIAGSGETRGRIQAVKAQAANALLATPAFVNATPAQKQELAEAMFVQAALIQATVDTYAGDPATLRKFSAAVTQGARASGLDLASMTLTPTGFKAVQ